MEWYTLVISLMASMRSSSGLILLSMEKCLESRLLDLEKQQDPKGMPLFNLNIHKLLKLLQRLWTDICLWEKFWSPIHSSLIKKIHFLLQLQDNSSLLIGREYLCNRKIGKRALNKPQNKLQGYSTMKEIKNRN